MINSREYLQKQRSPQQEKSRRKKESIAIIFTFLIVSAISYSIIKTTNLGADLPFSNTILMFILFNINMMLILFLIMLVFRNLIKLYYDRRQRVLGSKLRTKLVIAFITLTLLPTVVLFYFSIQFISTSLAFWFNAPVEQALSNSLSIGRKFYTYIEDNNNFFIDRIAYQLDKKDYMPTEKRSALDHYIVVSQRAFNLDSVEVYDKNANRISFSREDTISEASLEKVSANDLQHAGNLGKSHTITKNAFEGELIRTIGTIPFNTKGKDLIGYVVITTLVPPKVSEDMTSISRGFDEYQQIKLMKKPIRTSYFIALTVVALLVVFCAIWFAFYLAKSITIPIMKLAEGTLRVAEGDLSVKIEMPSDDEIGTLVSSFNKMTKDLEIGREQIALSAKMLKEQNSEIEERRQYMEIVLQNISAGVISLDSSGYIATINKAAEKMLMIDSSRVIRKDFSSLIKGQVAGTAQELREKIEQSWRGINFPLNLKIANVLRSYMVHSNALKDDNDNLIGVVLVFDDLTELEKAQRIAAWREVARRIAHEVKNPLTPISLSAQRLKRRYSKKIDDPVFDECTVTIIDHVELIRNLVNAFSSFAKFPTATPVLSYLSEIIKDTIVLYREGLENIDFVLDVDDEEPELYLDRQQIKQALINLIDNALEAMNKQGEINLSVIYDKTENIVNFEISDTGTGISAESRARLFEPYYSTKTSGTGLGLAIVSSIIADHNATIQVFDNKPSGAKFIIEFKAPEKNK